MHIVFSILPNWSLLTRKNWSTGPRLALEHIPWNQEIYNVMRICAIYLRTALYHPVLGPTDSRAWISVSKDYSNERDWPLLFILTKNSYSKKIGRFEIRSFLDKSFWIHKRYDSLLATHDQTIFVCYLLSHLSGHLWSTATSKPRVSVLSSRRP